MGLIIRAVCQAGCHFDERDNSVQALHPVDNLEATLSVMLDVGEQDQRDRIALAQRIDKGALLLDRPNELSLVAAINEEAVLDVKAVDPLYALATVGQIGRDARHAYLSGRTLT